MSGVPGLIGFPGPGPLPGVTSAAGLSDTVLRTTFVPTVSFGTPGDSTFAYTTQTGAYAKVGPLVLFWIALGFTPTYTTAAGVLNISPPPPAISDPSGVASGWSWNVRAASPTAPANTVTIIARPSGGPVINVVSLLSTGSVSVWGTAQFLSGTAYALNFSGYYF